MPWTTTRVLTLTVAGLAIGACSADEKALSAGDFRAGACRELAPAVLDIGRTAADLAQEAPLPAQLRAVTAAQDVLRGATSVPIDLATPVQQLVTDVGFLRFRSVSRTYEPALGEAVVRSYDALVRVCTGAATGER